MIDPNIHYNRINLEHKAGRLVGAIKAYGCYMQQDAAAEKHGYLVAFQSLGKVLRENLERAKEDFALLETKEKANEN